MEIVCAPETYRRFESSSLRQTKNTPLWRVLCFGWLRDLKRIRGTSCPLSKALIMPCRDEMSERRLVGVNVTERKEQLCAREP